MELRFYCVDDNHAQVCTINGETLFAVTKNMEVGDIWAYWHVTSNDDAMFDVKVVNEMEQGSSGQMESMKLGEKRVQVKQIGGAIKILLFILLNFAFLQK